MLPLEKLEGVVGLGDSVYLPSHCGGFSTAHKDCMGGGLHVWGPVLSDLHKGVRACLGGRFRKVRPRGCFLGVHRTEAESKLGHSSGSGTLATLA